MQQQLVLVLPVLQMLKLQHPVLQQLVMPVH